MPAFVPASPRCLSPPSIGYKRGIIHFFYYAMHICCTGRCPQNNIFAQPVGYSQKLCCEWSSVTNEKGGFGLSFWRTVAEKETRIAALVF